MNSRIEGPMPRPPNQSVQAFSHMARAASASECGSPTLGLPHDARMQRVLDARRRGDSFEGARPRALKRPIQPRRGSRRRRRRTSRRRCRWRRRPSPRRRVAWRRPTSLAKIRSHHRLLAGFPQDQSHRLLDLGRPDVEAAGEPHRQVVGAEADHVHPVEPENIVELIERALGLDLRAGDGEGVGGGEIVALMAELGAIRAPAAQAPGRIFHRAHEGLRVVHTVDERDT